jgi:hypothetical protein
VARQFKIAFPDERRDPPLGQSVFAEWIPAFAGNANVDSKVCVTHFPMVARALFAICFDCSAIHPPAMIGKILDQLQ